MPGRLATLLALALGACAGSSSGRVEYATVTVRSPELVRVNDDVSVVADADEPVFYADGHYWLHRGDRWYRSRTHDRNFVAVREPSERLGSIDDPSAYVRYRTRHQEARAEPPRDPFRDDDQQVPLQPTEPQQPPPAYPLPPQQQPPVPIDDLDVRGDSPQPNTDKHDH